MTRHTQVAALCLMLAWSVTGHAQTLLGPIPYRQLADSPFQGQALDYFYLEDFEDGALNTPGVIATTDPPDSARVNDSDAKDSVDADDGVLDGTGRTGRSWYLGFDPRPPGSQIKAIFTFDPSALGGFPTHVGLVWTDVGFLNGMSLIGQAEVVFEAFDGNGVSLGQVGPVLLGDGLYTGEALEDRFFGAVYLGGISRVEMTTLDSADWELDHLQYGRMGPLVTNFGFEAPPLVAGSAQANPAGAGWTFQNHAGISAPPNTLAATAAPEGSQYAFLQTVPGSLPEIRVVVSNFSPGVTYRLGFQYAGRHDAAASQVGCGTCDGGAPFTVLVDDVPIGTLTPDASETFTPVVLEFVPASTSVTVTFRGTALGGGHDDATTFIDQVLIDASPAAAQLSLAKAGATAAVGRVVSTPPAIDCGGACLGLFPVAAPPVLVAVPARGSVFTGWDGGGCSGLGTCIPTLVEGQSSQVTARFEAPPDRPVILSWPQAIDGAALSGDTVPIVFTVPPGATTFGLEFTGLNRVFGNPSGIGLDPVNGFGGAGGGFLIPGPSFDLALPPDLDDGVYQIRVLGLDAQLRPVGRFSEPLSVVVGAVTGGVPNLTSPGPGAVLQRGAPVTFEWMTIPFASQYLFTFAGGSDPVMVAGSVVVQASSLPVLIPPDIPPGGYRLRVMGLDAGGQPQGSFSTLDVTVQ